jgi:putative hemolysin
MDILIILVLLVFNGVLSMSETAMVSSQRIRLRQRADAGHRGAAVALVVSESPTRFLSTVQVGITLIGILMGAVGEAAIATDVRRALAGIPELKPISQPLSIGVVVLGITFLSVVLGELVPKRLALMAPEAIASALAIPLRLLSRVTSPLVSLLTATTDLLLLPVRGRVSRNDTVTSEEINIMVEEGARTGEFGPEERRLIERVLHLGDQRIDALMVHRTEMTWMDIATPLEKARKMARASVLSHFPVCKGTVDRIVGVVGLRDLLPGEGAGPTDLKSIARPPVFVPESAPVLRVLDRCRQAQTPAAFVVDEYGAVQGEVTVERILDRLVGRVWSAEPANPPATRS